MHPQPSVRPATIALLPAAMASATILYTLLAVLASFIISDLGATRAELGWVVFVFSISAAAFSRPIGRVADRLGARRSLLVVFGFTGIGLLLLSLAGALIGIMAAAVVIAVGQAMANPGTNKLIAETVPRGRRGLVTGIKQSGVQVGAVAGGLAFPALALSRGWRVTPAIVGVVALALLLVAARVLPRDTPASDGARRQPSEIPPGTYWITAYAFFMGAGGSPVFSFLPLYAEEAVGVSETVAGLLLATGAAFGIIARIAWSIGAERVGPTGPLTGLAALAVAASIMIAAAESLGVGVLWASTVVAFISIPAWNSVAMLAVITSSGPNGAGRSSGVVLTGFLTGLAVSPPLFGWSVDRLDSYRPGLLVVVALFTMALVTMLVWRHRSVAAVT